MRTKEEEKIKSAIEQGRAALPNGARTKKKCAIIFIRVELAARGVR